MMDFTLKVYKELLRLFLQTGYTSQTYNRYNSTNSGKIIVLRHDVDNKKFNSLVFAKIQHNLGICGTYYFRIVPQSFDEIIMREIAGLGHEVGYHYESMDTARGDVDKAYEDFCRNLERFRKIVPIETVCMHGSPLSKFDNRAIWEKYDYHSLGIKAEPYFDLDFNTTLYLTDTGRRWDGGKVSIRDKAMASQPVTNPDFLRRKYRSSFDIIRTLQKADFPGQVMMTFHPQRWTDKPMPWAKELVLQNVKNVVKRIINS